MGWPQRTDVWRDGAEPGRRAFVQVATAIRRFEPVTVCANPDQVETARAQLPADVEVIPVPQDDSWFRDTGPTFVVRRIGLSGHGRGELCGMNWVFNSWGEKNKTWELDNGIATAVLQHAGLKRIDNPFILEGGSIHVDGEGTLLTTAECLLNENRNPGKSKEEIEQNLKDCLGVSKIIWLDKGLYKDTDTDGHVDNFACFSAPGKVLLAWTDEKSDPQYTISKAALHVLEASTDARGRRIQVTKIPLPPPQFITQAEADGIVYQKGAMKREEGERLAASYANFLICNGAVVAPAFGEASADKKAAEVLQEAFPDREVIMIPLGRELVLGGGNVHCITQQQPKL